MIEKPRLKTFVTMFPITDSTWGVRGGPEELWKLKLPANGAMEAFCRLLPYLNGTQTRDAIAADLTRSGIEPAAPLKILDSLEKSGLIEEAATHGLSEDDLDRYADQLAFFSRFTVEGGALYQSRLKASKVGVLAGGELGECVCRQLAQAGVGDVVLLWNKQEPPSHPSPNGQRLPGVTRLVTSVDAPWPDDAGTYPGLFIYAEQRHAPSALEAMDTFTKEHGIPWLLVRATDVHEASVGPLFIPGETASYVSLEARLRGNMTNHDEYAAFDRHVRSDQTAARDAGGLRASFELLASIAVIEAVKLLTGMLLPALAGRIFTLNIVSWESELHEVLRVPRLERGLASPHQAFPWKDALSASK